MGLGQKTGLLLVVGLVRDDGNGVAIPRRQRDCLAGITLVADVDAKTDLSGVSLQGIDRSCFATNEEEANTEVFKVIYRAMRLGDPTTPRLTRS